MLNPNEVKKHRATQTQLDAMFERSNADAVARRDDQRQAAMWPHRVEQVLLACVKRITALEAAVAKLKASKP